MSPSGVANVRTVSSGGREFNIKVGLGPDQQVYPRSSGVDLARFFSDLQTLGFTICETKASA